MITLLLRLWRSFIGLFRSAPRVEQAEKAIAQDVVQSEQSARRAIVEKHTSAVNDQTEKIAAETDARLAQEPTPAEVTGTIARIRGRKR